MKLDDFGLQVLSSSERKLEALTPFLSYLTKSEGYYRNNSQSSADTYRRSPFPVDQIVHQWVRANVGQRRQLVNDLFAITYSCTELSSAIFVLKMQVFRRGLKDFEPKFTVKCTSEGCSKEFKQEVDKCDKCGGKVRKPDEEQYIRLKSMLDDCNIWDQSFLEIMKQAHEDMQIVDDCFIGLEKEFTLIDGKIHSRVIGISRLEPSLIEFDLSKQGLPKQNHWICPVHRAYVERESKDCPVCGLPMQAVMYKYSPYISSSDPQLIEQGTMYLLDEEVIHASKFHNSPTYGWSAILSMFEKVLTLIGMDKCYDEQTEVLTEVGWKSFKDLTYSDKLATRLDDGTLEYQAPVGIYDFPYDGKLYRVHNLFVDLLVTPQHRMYVKELGQDNFEFKEAKEIAGKPVYYLDWKGNPVYANVSTIQDSWEDYTGTVYCAEIPNGLLCVRRNGKAVWSGNSMFKYFFEREMPASLLMVATDDSEGLRREREAIIAQTRRDSNYVPFMAYSPSKGSRGRVDMVRLFHTLQEMDYLPVKNEIRERIAAMYGVTPIWQGSLEASGGISTQSMQIRASSMAAEADQRLFNEKIFPQILLAFNITDWILELEDPEEKAESTKIQFALQRIQAANQAFQMGFDVKIRGSGSMVVEDLDFEISGEAKKPDAMGGMGDFGGGMPPAAPSEGATPEMYGADYGAEAGEENAEESASGSSDELSNAGNMQLSLSKDALDCINKELSEKAEKLKKLTDKFLFTGKIPELPSPYIPRTKSDNKPESDETEEEFE